MRSGIQSERFSEAIATIHVITLPDSGLGFAGCRAGPPGGERKMLTAASKSHTDKLKVFEQMSNEPYAHISHRQDDFSGAYIRAVCAVTGCGIERITLDNDKVDYTVSSRVRGTVKTKPKIDIQAKCKMGQSASCDPIPYVIDLSTYDNLRDELLTVPRILVVVLVPDDVDAWVNQSETELVLSHCGYWLSLKGLPESETTTNKTVYLPRQNIFTPAALRDMMERTSNGLELA